MDVARLRLRELAAARWGGDVSPYFASMLHRTEAAIHELRQSTYAGVGTWPPASPTPPIVPRVVSRAAWRDDDPADAGVSALAQALAAGTFSVTDVVDALLARSSRLDPSLHVWATLDSAGARQRAGGRDEQIRSGAGLGPLMGVPIGVKDIINTDGLPTRANSRIAPPFATSEDAVALSWLVEAGAIVLGKTATTEYAYADPSEARNPWNPAHTPGGSSSGSAAGVAARMMPAALGTQTAGSVLRPAAYCGIVGFKPTTERISRVDVVPLAPSLDHVGTLTRSVADAALLFRVMSHAAERSEALSGRRRPAEGLRLALWPDLLKEHTDDATRAALLAAGRTLEQAGAIVELVASEHQLTRTVGLFEKLLAIHAVIMTAEVAASHLGMHPDRIADLGPRLRAMVEVGALIPAEVLLNAQHARCSLWHLWHRDDNAALTYDAMIVPAAPGTAPEGLDSTGDPSLNAPWSLLGVPAISLPITVAENGLPLAMQLVAPYGMDEQLLSVAQWCEQAINFTAKPPL